MSVDAEIYVSWNYVDMAGFVGTIKDVSPVCYSDPGMTNANMTLVEIDVDGDSVDNLNVKPELEVGQPLSLYGFPAFKSRVASRDVT